MNFKFGKKNKGFTLVELIMAMGIFVILMSIAAGGFISTIRSQRITNALMAVNNDMALVLEQMAREVRTGYNFCTRSQPILSIPECSSLDNNELQFINAQNKTVSYRLTNGAIEKAVKIAGEPIVYNKITADSVMVNKFNIDLFGNDDGDKIPPRITLSLSLSSNELSVSKLGIFTNIQTTISARCGVTDCPSDI